MIEEWNETQDEDFFFFYDSVANVSEKEMGDDVLRTKYIKTEEKITGVRLFIF